MLSKNYTIRVVKTILFSVVNLSLPSPARVAQWWTCLTHEFYTRLRGTFFPAYFRWLWKVVIVLVWESQDTRVRFCMPWYELSCWSGVKPQIQATTNQSILPNLISWRSHKLISIGHMALADINDRAVNSANQDQTARIDRLILLHACCKINSGRIGTWDCLVCTNKILTILIFF